MCLRSIETSPMTPQASTEPPVVAKVADRWALPFRITIFALACLFFVGPIVSGASYFLVSKGYFLVYKDLLSSAIYSGMFLSGFSFILFFAAMPLRCYLHKRDNP